MKLFIVGSDSSPQLRIFISYAWNDGKDTADELFSLCTALGYDVWLDRKNLRGGDVLVQELKDAIDSRDVILAIITPFSISSTMCRSEREYASTRAKLIIPILRDADAEIPVGLNGVIWRLFPRDRDVLLTDLAGCAEAITPDQLGPGLNRLAPSELQKWRTFSRPFAISKTTSGLTQLVAEINDLAKVLGALNFGGTAKAGTNNEIRALMFVQALLGRYAKFKRITERDIIQVLRMHDLKDDLIEGQLAKLVLERTLAPIRTIWDHKKFVERPDVVFGNSGLRVIYTILSMNELELMELPTFQHRGLDAAVSAMKLIEADGEIMSAAMLRVLLSSRDANTKTIVAHLARRFRPFGERVGSQWETVIQKAIKHTEGTEQELLDVEHNVNYMAAMHGSRAGIDNIMSIESNPVRLEATIAFNRNVSQNNFTQLLKMLNRKSVNPDKEEAWVKPWSAKLYNMLK
jgi:hypothetical protein